MKSHFLKTLAASLSVAAPASALSLYDNAPAIGLPESYAAKYSFTTKVGYDTNVRGTYNKSYRQKSPYVGASISTSYADYESVDKLSYNLNLGGNYYFSRGDAKSNATRYRGYFTLGANYSHAFSAMSRYVTSLSVTYTPESYFDDGMSNAGVVGNRWSWSWSNTYEEAIDARWSWNAGFRLYGTKYEGQSYSYNDYQTASLSGGLNYRASELLTYTSAVTAAYYDQKHGDSRSLFLNGGFKRSLDTVSSCAATVGIQLSERYGSVTASPTFSANYNRVVAEGVSLAAYARYENESTGTNSTGYKVTETLRVGSSITYRLSPDVSFSFGGELVSYSYQKPQYQYYKEYNRRAFQPSASMTYRFSEKMTGQIGIRYYRYLSNRSGYSYSRVDTSASLTYNF